MDKVDVEGSGRITLAQFSDGLARNDTSSLPSFLSFFIIPSSCRLNTKNTNSHTPVHVDICINNLHITTYDGCQELCVFQVRHQHFCLHACHRGKCSDQTFCDNQQSSKAPFQAHQTQRTSLRAFQRIVGKQAKPKEEKGGERPQSYTSVRSLPARNRSSSEPRKSHFLRRPI